MFLYHSLQSLDLHSPIYEIHAFPYTDIHSVYVHGNQMNAPLRDTYTCSESAICIQDRIVKSSRYECHTVNMQRKPNRTQILCFPKPMISRRYN